MARNFPVPLYTTATQFGASANQRLLSKTDPAAESTLTSMAAGLVGASATAPLNPEQETNTGGGNGDRDVPVAGKLRGQGWAFDVLTGLQPVTADSVTVAAGTWTFPLHFSRPGGLLTGNVTVNFVTIVLHRINFVPNPNRTIQEDSLQEIGRATSGSFVVTTTEQSISLSVTGGAAIFSPGQYLWIEVYVNRSNPVANDSVHFHTQSASALRISAAPVFTVQYSRAMGDSAPAGDGLARHVTNARLLADTAAAVSDGLIRKATFPRGLADTAPAVGDGLGRLVAFNRALADSAPVSDSLSRQISTFRHLAESIPMSDGLRRVITANRALADSAPVVSDGLIRQYIANRVLADSGSVNDAISRLAQYNRALQDAETVSDALARQVTYRRYMTEELSEGGGSVNYLRPFVLPSD